MARIRSIKPEFWTSEALATRLPGPDGRQARLLFIALWNHAEDHGVLRASPALLRSQAFPYDEDVTASDVSRWLGLLEAGGFIVRYERTGSAYAWVRGFDEHQKIDRKSKTTLPEPEQDELATCASPRDICNRPASWTTDVCASPRRALAEPSLQEGKGREGKGEDGNSSAAADAPPVGQAVLLDVPSEEVSEPAPKPKGRKQADGEHHALWRALEAEYLRVMGQPYASGNNGADATAVKWFRETAKVPPEEAVRRWGNLLAWSKNSPNGFPTVTGFKSLQQHWIAPQVVSKAQPGSNFGTAKPENKPNTPNILELEARWKAARQ